MITALQEARPLNEERASPLADKIQEDAADRADDDVSEKGDGDATGTEMEGGCGAVRLDALAEGEDAPDESTVVEGGRGSAAEEKCRLDEAVDESAGDAT
ncbi:uncharacterized protein KRP23_1283 [Phytophthora ramorum]|uniref:uncharacterized protein n=1 Tax=Phytophthora ramorum TaxID=164328 RepID=UPI0030AD764D|nr:hypothetical protein KRP23_1283 [Phytophthora ramorum]